VLARGRCPATLARLTDGELSSGIHCVKRRGTALARLSIKK